MQTDSHIWSALMEFRQSDAQCSRTDWMSYRKSSGFVVEATSPEDAEVLALLGPESVDIAEMQRVTLLEGRLFFYYSDKLGADSKMTLQLYWPLVYTTKCSNDGNPFVILHMAQSLDGKICTCSGSSKWIGNKENLVHAHRLRACVDGVLVGGNTLAADAPKLNVRHVDGPDPVRLFLTNTFDRFGELPKVPKSKTYLLRKDDGSGLPNNLDGIDKTISFSDINSPLKDLLRQLKTLGIHSILIEGGPVTVSSFWQSGCIDWAQIHIAPIVLGGGKSFVQLSGIEDVSDGVELSNVFYTKMGEAMMITGACTHSNWLKPVSKTIHESESTLA